MPLDRIGPEDVAEWFDAASRDKPGAANRALEIPRAMMFRAEEWGLLRERDTNPCLGIAMNPRKRVARFLDAHETRWPEAVAAIRLLALTGCRRSEVLDLRCRDIGPDALNRPASRTRTGRRWRGLCSTTGASGRADRADGASLDHACSALVRRPAIVRSRRARASS